LREIVRPYIVRVVSLSSGVGKTRVVERICSYLSRNGYRFAVIKHAAKGIDIDEKDSARALRAGAPKVLVSSHGLAALYIANWVDDLETSLTLLAGTPIIVVEGFRGVDVGDVIGVVSSVEEVEELRKDNLVALVSTSDRVVEECKARGYLAYRIDSDELPQLVVNRALEYIASQLPGTDCGYCGYSTCRGFAEAFLRGRASSWCPRSSEIRLRIDGVEIPMNPFVRNVLRNIVLGFVNSLKNVPERRQRIDIEIELY